MKIDVTEAQSTVRATVANALAEALVLGIDEVAQRTTPLTQKQQVALAAMSIMSYDKALEACDLLELAFAAAPKLPREPFDPKLDYPERYQGKE